MGGFREQLESRAGGSLRGLDASNERVRSWNEGIEQGHARAFDDRVLLGLGIDERKPRHGDLTAYQVRVGELLGRSDRWVRETVAVAVGIRTALEFGVELPEELRRIPWRVVPTAIENVKAGRALDYRPPKEKKPPTVRAIRKLVKQLVAGLKGLEDEAIRERERELAIEALSELEMPSGVPEVGRLPEPPARPRGRPPRVELVEEPSAGPSAEPSAGPEVETGVSPPTVEPVGGPSGEVEADPVEEPTVTPTRPGRRRPGRRGPGGRGGRGSGGRGSGR